MKKPGSPLLDPAFPASGKPDALVAALDRADAAIDRSTAQAVRDRVATLVMADPATARKMACALLRAASASPVAGADVLAIAWRSRAEAEMLSGRAADAVVSYENACRRAEAAHEPGLLGQILVGRVHLLALLGQTGRAERLAVKAGDLLTEAGDLVYLGKLHMNRGNAFYQQDQYSRALGAYAMALEVFDRMGVRDASRAGLLMNLGIVHANLSRIREADSLLMRAEEECLRLGLDNLRAWAACNRALMLALLGHYRDAVSLVDDAAAHFETQGVRDMAAAALRSRAEIYLDLGMLPEAADSSERAADVFESEGMKLDAALSRTIQGRALMELGHTQRAVELLKGVRALFRKTRNQPRLAGVDLHLARLAASGKRYRDSRRLAAEAAKRLHGLGTFRLISEARRIQAESYLAQGRISEAADALGPALEEARRQPIRERIEIWSLASRAEQLLGRRGRALSYMRRAMAGVEAERRMIPGPEYRARAFEDRVRVYHQRIGLELEARRPRPDLLFRLVESARARGFHDRAARQATDAGTHRSDRRARLGSLVQRLEQAQFPETGLADAGSVRSLQGETLALEREIAEEVRREAAVGGAGCARLDRDRGAVSVDPDRVQAALHPDETLVEYFTLADRLTVFVLSRSGFEMRILPLSYGALSSGIDRVRFLLDAMSLPRSESGPGALFARAAAENALADLHRTLMDPISDLIPAGGLLTIVPHGLLHAVPFECLYDGSDYVDSRHVIRRCPSARHLTTNRRRRRSGSALVAGLVEGGPASVPEELSTVREVLSAEESDVLMDPTAEALLNALPKARIVHLATHGVFREDNPLFSRLSTADGAVFVADLLGCRIHADLVVLSACAAGRTFAGRGDDLAGVAHGFLAAGARTLVAGMWRISDEATLQLMREFYLNYCGSARGDAAQAMGKAGRAIRREWGHPFYWGGFSVHGT